MVQIAAKLMLEPIFEADLEDNTYGYRPARSAVDAVRHVHQQRGTRKFSCDLVYGEHVLLRLERLP